MGIGAFRVGHTLARRAFLSGAVVPKVLDLVGAVVPPMSLMKVWVSSVALTSASKQSSPTAMMARSSARTRGVISEMDSWTRIHGRHKSARTVIERGHPWGMEHLLV